MCVLFFFRFAFVASIRTDLWPNIVTPQISAPKVSLRKARKIELHGQKSAKVITIWVLHWMRWWTPTEFLTNKAQYFTWQWVIKIVIQMAQYNLYGSLFMSCHSMKISEWLTENFSFEKEYGWLLVGGEWRYRCWKYMFKYFV